MQISLTKNKTKLSIVAAILLVTLLCFAFSSLFVFHYSKWLLFPLFLFLEAISICLLLFDFRFSEKCNSILNLATLVLFPFCSLIGVEILQKSWKMASFKAYLVNYLIFLAVYLLLTLVTTQVKFAVMIGTPLFLVLGLVNHYVLCFRGTPMQPWDIAAAKTAMNVVNNFIFTIDEYVIISFLLAVIMILFACSIKTVKVTKKERWISVGVLFALMLVCIGVPYNQLKGNHGKFHRDLWNQTSSSAKNGYVANFLLNIQLMNNKAPETYSVEKVRSTLQSYVKDGQNADKLPNIIVIMNEAFADLSDIDDIGLEKDYIPFVRSFSKNKNAVTGNLEVSVFGGGTCNTEYEFLTSNVCSMLRAGSYPMQQFVNSPSVSIASNLKQIGYKTVGLHPYYGSGWNRSRSYPLLGFDEFITIDDFDDNTEMIREYVSDSACYERIEQEIEHSQEQPLFLFAVTMQNHGGYETAWEDMPNNVKFKNEGDFPQLNRYLELANLSDKAFQELIQYIDNGDTDTIVLFFGDHQPSLGEEYAKAFPSTTEDDLSKATKKYFVPFVMWANFDIDSEHIANTSPNYLAPLLLEKAGLPQTAYYRYLNDLRKGMPSITAMALRNKNDKIFELEDPASGLEDKVLEYDILQYNNVFDKDHLQDDLFYYYK